MSKIMTSTQKDMGRRKARRLYPVLGKCELCDNKASDRHHKDSNTYNNDLSNVMLLCRYHHMEADGRLAEFLRLNDKRPALKTAKRCIICGIYEYPLRKGRCHACNEYLRRTGSERPIVTVNGQDTFICSTCGAQVYGQLSKSPRCKTCARKAYLIYHANYEKEWRRRIKEGHTKIHLGEKEINND
jgi:hypothetical protein